MIFAVSYLVTVFVIVPVFYLVLLTDGTNQLYGGRFRKSE